MEVIHISSAREAAFTALRACETQGAWADQAIRSASKKQALSPRDAALAAHLCYGVVQNRLLLDFWIDRFSTRPASALDTEVRLCLRLGLYQLRFLDRVPASAAVNESVSLARKYARHKGASGLVNAVLRAFQRAPECPMPHTGNALNDFAIRYSHPVALVELLAEELGGDVEPLLACHNAGADTTVQVNTLRTTQAELCATLRAQGVTAEAHPWLENCLLLQKTGDLERLKPFQQGWFYVQDSAARLAVLASGVGSGDRVLDACAAPGGKSFAAAIQMAGEGQILSRDLHENKLKHIRSGAKRLGLDCIQTEAADARTFQPELADAFDVVLADVPCSGLGIIRKKPDIRYKSLAETEGLPPVQRDILRNVARYVRPGGVLVYSTCTVLRRENLAVVEAFLQEQAGRFRLETFTLPSIGTVPGYVTLWPHLHGTDGFFIAKLRRANE